MDGPEVREYDARSGSGRGRTSRMLAMSARLAIPRVVVSSARTTPESHCLRQVSRFVTEDLCRSIQLFVYVDIFFKLHWVTLYCGAVKDWDGSSLRA